MIQPSLLVITEIARFIKANSDSAARLYSAKKPDRIADDWKIVAKECNFRWLTPMDWRHSYATIGAIHLAKLYKSNPMLLSYCCIHKDYRTTQEYIEENAPEFIDAFFALFADK